MKEKDEIELQTYISKTTDKKYKSLFKKIFYLLFVIYICTFLSFYILLQRNNFNSSQILFIFLPFLCVTVLFITTIVCIYTIFKRFNILSANFKNVTAANYTRVPEEGNDEITLLGVQINEMIEHIEQLNSENVKRQLTMKNAEIKSLQNQINAHFMYNVLESIKMMAEIKEDYEISDAVTSLGQMFRYSMKWTSGLVELKEEIEYIQKYLNLLNLRFDYEIYLSLNIPHEFMDFQIPKMSLQPIVENSVYHGIEDMAEDTSIYIKVYEDEEKGILNIEVSDAGKGISEDKLKEIKVNLYLPHEDESSEHGRALRNVNERIQMFFGKEYGLDIFSKKGLFTKVVIQLPRERKR